MSKAVTVVPEKIRHKPGPKPFSKSGELMKPRAIRMTDAEWLKCKALGGSPWVRERIRTAHWVHVSEKAG